MTKLRTSKYNKVPKKKTSDTNPDITTTMAKEDNTEEKINVKDDHQVEDHTEFRKGLEETIDKTNTTKNEPTLEPLITSVDNPHSKPKTHRDYSLNGIKDTQKKEPVSETVSQEKPVTHTSAPQNNTTEVEDDFNPTPPEDDAPQNIVSEDGPPPGSEEAKPFNLPSGTAEDLLSRGIDAINYLIDQYGDLAVGIPIHQDFYMLKTAVPMIKEQNQRNVERLKISPAESKMLIAPLVKIMQEKGIRGLTPTEELGLAVLVIVVGKIKVVVQIRIENKKLTNVILAEIHDLKENYMKKYPQNTMKETGSTVKKEEPEPELHEVEEVHA